MQTLHELESGAQTSPCSDNECSSEWHLGTRRVRASQGPYVLIRNHSTGVQWQVLGSVNINVSTVELETTMDEGRRCSEHGHVQS
jgi:hypothetical protein